jgi:hypothetical protein
MLGQPNTTKKGIKVMTAGEYNQNAFNWNDAFSTTALALTYILTGKPVETQEQQQQNQRRVEQNNNIFYILLIGLAAIVGVLVLRK